jgi:hypothetical protein
VAVDMLRSAADGAAAHVSFIPSWGSGAALFADRLSLARLRQAVPGDHQPRGQGHGGSS